MEYPGTSDKGFGESGNKVIFGHSSNLVSEEGRYKTHFAKIIELDVGEKIYVYKKNSSGVMNLYIYIVEDSYDTKPDDVSILSPGIGSNLTLFTCTPIGGISGRWVIKAKYFSNYDKQLDIKVNFLDISIKYKRLANKFLSKFRKLNLGQKVNSLKIILTKINNYKINGRLKNDKKILRLFDYIEFKLMEDLMNHYKNK